MDTVQFYDVHYTATTHRGDAVERCATFLSRNKNEAELSAKHHYGQLRGFRILWIDPIGTNPF